LFVVSRCSAVSKSKWKPATCMLLLLRANKLCVQASQKSS
jgi:hypothetical protein